MTSKESVIIVGGSTGLGKKLALRLSTSSRQIVILSRREPEWISSFQNIKHQAIDLSCLSEDDVKEKIRPLLLLTTTIIFSQRYRAIAPSTQNKELQTSVESIGRILDCIVVSNCALQNQNKVKVLIVGSVYGHRVGLDQGWEYHCAKAAIESMVRYFAIRHSDALNIVGVRPSSFRRTGESITTRNPNHNNNDRRSYDIEIAESCINILEILNERISGNLIDLDACKSFEYHHLS